jgi:hypothetical protein
VASTVSINLDTTGPAGVSIVLDGGAPIANSTAVSAAVTTTDTPTTGYQVKFWGDITSAATEALATWVALASPHALTLTTGDAVKTVNAKIRDNVANESAIASDTITLDTTLPVVTVTSGPTAPKISEVTGFDKSSFTWSVDSSFDEYKVKVVLATGDPHTAGTLIPATAGSTNVAGALGPYPAATNITTGIDATDLKAASPGDGDKIVKVFARQGTQWSAT